MTNETPDLSGNRIGDAGAEALAGALKTNQSLTEVAEDFFLKSAVAAAAERPHN